MRDIEHRLQVACVRWFRMRFPKHLLIAIPNGGARNAITGAKLKAEGVTAGAPDLFLFASSGGYHGLAIEMKTETGRQSSEQKAFQQHLQDNGYRYELCRNIGDFISAVEHYLQPEEKTYI